MMSIEGCESESLLPAREFERTCSIESIIIDVRESMTNASGCDAISPAICLGRATENLR